MYNITLYRVIHVCTILHHTELYMHIQYYIIHGYTCTYSSLLVCVSVKYLWIHLEVASLHYISTTLVKRLYCEYTVLYP